MCTCIHVLTRVYVCVFFSLSRPDYVLFLLGIVLRFMSSLLFQSFRGEHDVDHLLIKYPFSYECIRVSKKGVK